MHYHNTGEIYRLLIALTNSFDPYQDIHNAGPNLDRNHFHTLLVFMKDLFGCAIFENYQQTTKTTCKNTQHAKMSGSEDFIFFFQLWQITLERIKIRDSRELTN